jgi:uncharacterized protein YndB with AHSA1/START domain
MSAPIAISASIDIDAPPAAVFRLATGDRLPDFIRAQGILPGVASIEGTARWNAAGETRRLTLSDGGALSEELTALSPDRSFSYRAFGFDGPFGRLVREGRGAWRFEPAPGGARVVWHYEFLPKGGLSAPLVFLIAKGLWPGYMRAALTRLKEEAEKT